MKFAIVYLSVIFMFGCSSHNIQMYGQVDLNNKTVTVPPGSKGLKGELKNYLSKNGWELFVYRGPSVTEGEVGEKTRVQQYDTFKSKYKLIAASRQYDVCFNFSPAIHYDISFINNITGAEIFTIDGRGCESDVVKKFDNAINGIRH